MFCSTYNKSLTHAATSGEVSHAQREHLCFLRTMPRCVCLGAIALGCNRFRAPRRSQLRGSHNTHPRVRVAINNEPAERLSFQKVDLCECGSYMPHSRQRLFFSLSIARPAVPFKGAVTQTSARPAPQLGTFGVHPCLPQQLRVLGA